ncbi:amino acid adenylation domain-containing protein [Antrihabitans sp. YC2-6]|nr:amino acid adenylation domain-containing protein [Antrihabitans sp. YC2-6]
MNPTGIAISFDGREISYAELDAQSSRLARVLIGRGLGPEDLVAVGIPRSIESVLAVWAVAKTGAGFVPVDPNYPPDRIAHMVGDSRVVIGVTIAAALERVSANDVEWLVIDGAGIESELADVSSEPVSYADRVRPLRAENVAYVIYTSGSTGLPKGVVVTQSGLSNFCTEQRERYRLTAEARTLHFASPSFDASVLELLLAVAAGSTMVIVPPGIYGGAELASIVAAQRVTHGFVTPAALASVDPAGLDEFRVVCVGGEACPPELVNRWAHGREFFNGYGPTETTIMTNISDPLQPGEAITIGPAIRNMTALVLDARLQRVPVGVAGELYLSGLQLARGYHERRALTTQRFVANPYAAEPGERMYRTGDIVRLRDSGEVEFVGRNDSQLKIRGFRIEPGEIDAALTAHPDIAFAVTIGRETSSGTTALVAYVLPDENRVLDTDEVLEFVGRMLPVHMVPTVLMVLDKIPLTPVGKLDRDALPEPVFEVREYSPPANAAEELVARVFSQVLSVERVGRDDDFFDLGGNSLIATKVAARLGAELDARVPARFVFESSTVSALATAVEVLRGEGGRPRLTPQTRPENIPLSLAQQRMWFLNRFDTASALNNIPFAIRLVSELDPAVLGAAVRDVIERHESLRTVYPEDGGIGHQVVLPTADVVSELAAVPVAESELIGWITDFAMRGFDVTAAVPLRIALLAVGPAEHVLAIVVHHIAADGASLVPMVRDLVGSYLARLGGSKPDLPALPVQYADYTLWQRTLLGAESNPNSLAAQQLTYWRQRLDGLPDRIDLPLDRPRPVVGSNAGATYEFVIDDTLRKALEELGRNHEASLFMVVHAAFAAVLGRVSATTDVTIGTPIAGRGEEALDDLVGMFVNTLVLRTDVDPGLSFTDLLVAVRDDDLAAFTHADMPFERLVEVLDPVRSTAHHPLFQVALFFQNMGTAELELPGLRVEAVEFDGVLAKFDLQLTISVPEHDSPGSLGALFTYATDLFDDSSIRLLAGRLLQLLSAVAANSDRPVGDIDLLDASERRELLIERNATDFDVSDEYLLAGFDAQVLRTPDAPAVVFEGDQLTYGEFDARVNQVARLLISNGVGPESLVALAMRRSIDLVVGMYAVVRAGGAYVPIDPDHPAERIAHVLDTAQPACILSTTRDGFAAESGAVIEIDAVDLSPYSAAALRADERRAVLRGDHPAYAIFTSGSTGRPKGVAVPHSAIANQVAWMQSEYRLDASDVYLQKTATTFDVSLWGYFMPLRVGATLVVATPDGHRDPLYLADTIAAQHVTITDFVPSMLAVFAGQVDAAQLRSLRHVFVIGEALPPETVSAFAAVSSAGLHNLYGPTEAAVSITYWPARVGERQTREPIVAIGRPEWNSAVYVLDSRLQPVPDGVPGELYLAGVQLARGYVTRPDLSADRFVANPYSGSGDRMYRTGDLVRWSRDGILEYIGRTDFQVKFRGQRIELGEIETALLGHTAVQQAVAVVQQTVTGDQLVSYVVPGPGATVAGDELVSWLDGRLPTYMVPAAVVVLDEFPLNSSGKLDRKALPEPTFEQREFRAPTTPVEEIVAGVFADLLGGARVGLDDDFFALGGNSLVATQAVARLGAALGTRIPVRTLFEASTVQTLAARVEAHSDAGPGTLLAPRVRPAQIPLSLAQQRMWFLNRLDPDSAVNNLPVAIRLTGDLNVAALQAAVGDVIWRHESLRTVFPEQDGKPYQQIRTGADVVPDLTPVVVPADAVVAAVSDFAFRGFDVTSEIPVRVRLFEVSPHEHVLTVVVHHISGDGFSMGPLTRDLVVAYEAQRHGAEPNWPPLAVQYADFALWQREALGSEQDANSLIAKQIDYWRTTLSGLPQELELPTDRPRPQIAGNRGGNFSFTVAAEVHGGLAELAREHNSTLFMAVHAALAVLLARTANTTDVAIGTPVAGRGEEQLDSLIGMFVNTLVLRTDVNPHESFAELLTRARATDIGAFGNADLPFERLVEILDPERSQARHPLFQVMLTFQNMARAALELPGLTVSSVEFDIDLAKFDLQFTLSENTSEDGAPAGLLGVVTYATELFDESTVAEFVDRFQAILAAAVRDAAVPTGDIALLGDADRAQVLFEWNDPVLTAADATLVQLFDERVRRSATSDALVHGELRINYGELDARANRLARKLIAQGVGPEALVAVALPRSVELVVALLAVLKAGGAYLPIDVTYPRERLEFMLSDARPVCLMTQGDAAAGLGAELPVVDVGDTETFDDAPVTDADRNGKLRPENAAYVIYTSGSTGRPKGVLIPHRNVVRLFAHTESKFGFGESDVWTLFHSYAFDFSVWELWGPLLHGGALVVVDYFTTRSPDEFRELLVRERVTVLNQTPSAFYQLAEADRVALTDEPETAGELALRYVVFGGEALELRRLQSWYERHADDTPQLVNMYGITETTVHVSHSALDSAAAASGAASVIGRAIPGLGVYVLDQRLHPVPIGVAGEMYVVGGQLARGYLRRPGLSAGRFVADPYGAPGALMYRTGDIGRWNSDGQLEYAGRSDSQVQLRGFRIELGEIEAALLRHESVADAVAIVRSDERTGERLVGYVVPRSGGAVDTTAVSDFVSGFLTDYMVPDVLVVLAELPLTANGKLDRRALPAPSFVGSLASRAPETELEKSIASVFAEVLGLETVGADDSFFALGGDSIVSIQLVSRAKSRGVVFTPRDVFERKTVAGLAEAAQLHAESGAAPVELVELEGGGVGPMPLPPIVSFMVGRGGGFDRYNQSVALELPIGIERSLLVQTVAAVIDRHDVLRAKLTRVEDDWLLVTEPAGSVDVDALVTRLEFDAALDTAAVAALAVSAQDAALGRLDPANGVVLQFVWLDPVGSPTRSGRLVVVAHHLVVDGVSWRILIPDFIAAWGQLSHGQNVALPAVGTSMRRWAHALVERAVAPDLVAQLPFWRATLAGADPALGDRPFDPAIDLAIAVEKIAVSIPADVTEQLLTTVPKLFHGGVNDGLLAALALAVSRWRRDRGIAESSTLLSLEGHGREEGLVPGADLARTVGWFTSIFPVRLDLAGIDLDDAFASGPAAGAAVKAVKEQLAAVPERGVGYGLLRYLNPDTATELGAMAGGQITFNYLGRISADDVPAGFADIGWIPAGDLGDLSGTPDPDMPAMTALDINAIVVGGQLSANFGFPTTLLERADVNELAEHWIAALRALVDHVAQPGAGGLTPSDLPLVSSTQRDVDAWEAHYPAMTDVWPLSPLQAGMYFHAMLAATSVDVYTAQVTVGLDGTVDTLRLRAAAQAVLDRYPNLRTAFLTNYAGEPVQVVLDHVDIDWAETDLTSSSDSDAAVQRLAETERSRRFDLTAPPLLRFRFVTLAPGRFRLIITNHHVLLDGWSMPLLMKDLLVLYATRGDASVLPAPRSYRNFLEWVSRQDADESMAAWRKALAGVDEPTLLAPADRARQITSISGEYRFGLDEAETAELSRFAAQTGVTVNNVVQAAWGVLLGKLTGDEDVVFGTTVSGRPPELPGVEDMVGLFINTLPVRVRCSAADSVATVLEELQASQASLLGHHLVRLADINAVAGAGAQFDTLFVFESYPIDAEGIAAGASSIDGMSLASVESADATHYPVTVIAQLDSTLKLRMTYLTELFDGQAIELLARRYRNVLAQMIARPEAPVGDIDVVESAERTLLLQEWQNPGSEQTEATLLDLFRSWVSASPGAVALVDGADRISYGELSERANRLARRLIRAGVGPDDRVALALGRSADLVVGVLGVLQAGAAYVPLDITHPASRLEFILADSAPVCVVSTSDDLGDFPATTLPVLRIDDDSDTASGEPVADSDRTAPLRPDNLAYIIYTSGSTGRPKGVGVTHRNVVELLRNSQPLFGFDDSDVWTLFHSYAFDFSVWELWGALAYGGRLVIVDYFTTRTPQDFLELLVREQVTFLNQTPAAFYQLAEADRARSQQAELALRHVVFGGEALDLRRLRDWYERRPATPRLVNMYGITETTVHVSFLGLNAELANDAASIIGRGLPGLSVYVLDSRLRPVPVGVPGEVYVTGRQLSRGYLGRPDLAAVRFVANPFGGGDRMYRTGDLARWNADGQLEYAGRSDLQVQLRGFRIELGEIEAALAGCAGVAHAVAVVRSDAGVEDRLVGYVVPQSGASVDPAEVRTAVGEFLTGYMVPDAIVTLDELPLTPNGKLDRKGLPAPEFVSDRPFREPETDVEQAVAAVIADVLDIERIGLDDDFFALGGNSLSAARVAARLRDLTLPDGRPAEFQLQWLFAYRTVADVAQQLTAPSPAAAAGGLGVVLPIRTPDADDAVFCIHPLMGLAWMYTSIAQFVPDGLAVYGVQSPALVDAEWSPESIDAIAERYVDEIRAVRPSGPYRLLGWSLGGVIAHAMAVRLQALGAEVSSLVMLDSVHAIDLDVFSSELADTLLAAGITEASAATLTELTDDQARRLLDSLGADASVTIGQVQRLFATAVRSARLSTTYRPETFAGDLVFVSAEVEHPSAEDAALTWQPYVSGAVVNHPVPARHSELLGPDALSLIGPILAAEGNVR